MENNNNNKFYGIGRLQYTVKDPLPGYIQLAVSGSHGNSEGTISGNIGPLLRGRRTILGSDIEVELNRLYFAAEYLRGALETVDLPDVNELISGYYFTVGMRLTEKTMTFGRWQSWSYRKLGTNESKLTLGTNIDYTDIVGLILNLDMYMPDQGNNMLGASFIFQVIHVQYFKRMDPPGLLMLFCETSVSWGFIKKPTFYICAIWHKYRWRLVWYQRILYPVFLLDTYKEKAIRPNQE